LCALQRDLRGRPGSHGVLAHKNRIMSTTNGHSCAHADCARSHRRQGKLRPLEFSPRTFTRVALIRPWDQRVAATGAGARLGPYGFELPGRDPPRVHTNPFFRRARLSRFLCTAGKPSPQEQTFLTISPTRVGNGIGWNSVLNALDERISSPRDGTKFSGPERRGV